MTAEVPHSEPQGPQQLIEMLRTPYTIKAILFDMDGLLVDTEIIGIHVAVEICRNLDMDIDQDEQQGFIGITVEEFYRELFNRRRVNYDVSSVLAKHFEEYEEFLKTDIDEFDGARTLPRDLKLAGYSLGLVSGSTGNQVESILNSLGIRSVFDTIVSFDDIKKGKPDPEGYLTGARRLGVDPKNCLVFEDATAGILAARSAGMRAVGVVNRGGQDLSYADFIIPNLSTVKISPARPV